jgi:hypothetical protein
MAAWLRDEICLSCGKTFYLHLRCDRGDRHCSEDCATKRRKQLLAGYQRTYQSSEKGKITHREAQRAYRIRLGEAAAGAKGRADLKEVAPIVPVAVMGDRTGLSEQAGDVEERGEHGRAAGGAPVTARASAAQEWPQGGTDQGGLDTAGVAASGPEPGGVDKPDGHAARGAAAVVDAAVGHQASADLKNPDTPVVASDCPEPVVQECHTDRSDGKEGAPTRDATHNPVTVIDQGALPTTRSALIVAARPGGLAASNDSPDATVVVGDCARPAIHADGIDEPGRPERAPGALAVLSAAPASSVAPVRGARVVVRGAIHRCARCGRPGQVLRHADMG